MTLPPTPLESRRYAGAADLPVLLSFAAASTGARWPLDATWHPGNIVWNLKAAYDTPQALRLWTCGDEAVAAAWFVGPGELYLEVLPTSEDAIPNMLEWAEAASRRQSAPALSVRALENDTPRIHLLESLGYRRAGVETVCFRKALSSPTSQPSLPPGATALDCTDIDIEARAACHRDAWSALDHIGIQGARSSFSAEVYRSLRAAALYDPRLDVVIQAPDGRLASNCICWADQSSGVGLFEPVGTGADYRGQGYGRAAVLEGLRRLKTAGLRWARVGTAHFNAPAIATYLSCGFELIDRTSWWAKPLT